MNLTILSCPRKRGGFSLVEILVVVVIVAILVSVVFTVGPKMTARAKATEMMQNMRQIGPLLTNYAIEHSMKLPAIKGNVVKPDGTEEDLQWNEVVLMTMYPDTAVAEFRKKEWWNNNKKLFLRNPMLQEDGATGWAPLNPGYAMNEMIAVNLATMGGQGALSHEDAQKVQVSMGSLADPGMTPLLAPCDRYYYRYDDAEISRFSTGNMKELLSEGKFPVIFADNHVETVTPKEYVDRKLDQMPLPREDMK